MKSIGLMWLLALAVPEAQLSEREQLAASQHFKRGMESLLADRYDAAEQEFKGAVAIDPLYDAAFYGLGQVYMATKRYPDALKAYLASRDAFKAATGAEVLSSAASDRRIRDQIDALKDNERNMTRLISTGSSTAQSSIDSIREQIQKLESRKGRRAAPVPHRSPPASPWQLAAPFRLNDLPNAEKNMGAASK
jgi:tetratricopeptide (TPR) repeat protein